MPETGKQPVARTRVLMLITELSMGGAARMVRELSNALRRDMDVVEAVFNHADGVDFPGSQAPISLDVRGGGEPAAKVMNLARRVSRARRLKRDLKIDVSISHLEGAHWVDVLSRGREKVILCMHGSILHNGDVRGAAGWLRSRVIMPLVCNRADRIVTVSRGIADELASLGVDRRRIVAIPNGFDLATIERRAAEPLTAGEERWFDGVPVLIATGRLAAQKNHSALLDVFADLRRRRPCRLLIAGDGPLRSRLLDQAQTLGLVVAQPWTQRPPPAAPDVVFLGVQANPFRFMARADLYLMTSGWEGFPLALCEAMACGTPVVTTDCFTGPREILSDGASAGPARLVVPAYTPSGVLMPLLHEPGTYDQARACWVDLLDSLLDQPERRVALAANARERVKLFSQAAVASRWEQLIRQLVAD